MIVLDASAAVSALLNAGPARSVLASDQAHAPHLIDVEVASAFRRLVASHQVAADQATEALAVWQRLGLVRHPVVGLLDRVWALRATLGAYDACYVAVAEALGCPLLTADARLARAPGIRCPLTVVPR